MEEQNVNTTPKKGSKKPLIICLSIILILAIAAAVIVFILIKSGKLNIGKKAKIQAGVDQLIESVSKPIDDIYDSLEKGDLSIKVANNISLDKKMSITGEVSGKIDTFEVDGMSSSEREVVSAIKDLLTGSNFKFDLEYDGDKDVYFKSEGTVDGNSVSGELGYIDDELVMRSKDASEKWVTMTKKDLIAQSDLKESDFEEMENLKKQLSTIFEKSKEASESMKIDEKTSKEIKDRYNKVLKDFISKKEKDIEKEKAKVKVGGKDKSCDKLTLTLKTEDLKKLAKNYVNTFKDDKQVQEIIKKGMKDYIDQMTSMAEELGDEYALDTSEIKDVTKELDDIFSRTDEVIEAIDSFGYDIEVKIIVYATSTDILRTDLSFEFAGVKVIAATTFEEDKSVTKVSYKSGSQSADVATLEISGTDGEGKIKFELDETIAAATGMDALSGEISYKITDSSEEVSVKFDAGDLGKGTFEVKSNVNTNTDTEFNGDFQYNVDVEVEDVKIKGSLNSKIGIKVDSASIPTIESSKKVKATNNDEINAFGKEVAEELKKSDNAIRKFVLNPKLESIYDVITGGDSLKEDFEDLIEEMENPSTMPDVIENVQTEPAA